MGVTGCYESCYQGAQKVVGAAWRDRDGGRVHQKYFCFVKLLAMNLTDSNLEDVHARSEIG